MEIDKLFGLPAHPLIVHAPLVLIPLTALVAVLFFFKPDLRDRYGIYLAGWSIVLFGLTVLATGSGEKLEARVGESSLLETHAELGEQLRNIAGILALATCAWIAAARLAVTRHGLVKAVLPLGLAVVVLSGAATVWDVRTGHAGAKAVWKETADKPVADAAGD